jgi:hypothetical protein
MQNYGDTQQAHRVLGQRAGRITDRIADQARAIGESRAGTGRTYVFHLAHNWQNLDSITEEQRQACREILRLERRRHRIDAIARAMIDKLWADYDDALLAHVAAQSKRGFSVNPALLTLRY